MTDSNDSLSEGSVDEEEVIRNFDLGAEQIIRKDTLTEKLSDRYLLNYKNFKAWLEKIKIIFQTLMNVI